MIQYSHKSVLLEEVINYLHIIKGESYIDTTLGLGGHTIEIIKHGGRVLGIETDRKMLELANKRIMEACPPHKGDFVGLSFKLVNGNFRDLDKIALDEGFSSISGILFDLGISSAHYQSSRGFSFMKEEDPLDMRLDTEKLNIKASDLLNVLGKKQLYEMLLKFMSEKNAYRFTQKIIRHREIKRFETVSDLLEITGKKSFSDKTHPATKLFLALRVTVNDELNSISEAIPKAIDLLRRGGRVLIITFHSLEESVVKELIKKFEKEKIVRNLLDKALGPTEKEVESNPRARSAKLWVIEKI